LKKKKCCSCSKKEQISTEIDLNFAIAKFGSVGQLVGKKLDQTNGLVTSQQISIVDFHPHLCWHLECRRLCRVLENREADSPL
jgi:hypothetical protein